MTEGRHGCFSGNGTVLSGQGTFTVAISDGSYIVTYATPMGASLYTLTMDGRANNGRSLGMGAVMTNVGLTLNVNWLEATETVASICFVAVR